MKRFCFEFRGQKEGTVSSSSFNADSLANKLMFLLPYFIHPSACMRSFHDLS